MKRDKLPEKKGLEGGGANIIIVAVPGTADDAMDQNAVSAGAFRDCHRQPFKKLADRQGWTEGTIS